MKNLKNILSEIKKVEAFEALYEIFISEDKSVIRVISTLDYSFYYEISEREDEKIVIVTMSGSEVDTYNAYFAIEVLNLNEFSSTLNEIFSH